MAKDKDDKPVVKGRKPTLSDMDTLDKFPLSIVPLTSNSLKNAKLIKNARMETTLELHNDPITGSYQIPPEAISDSFKGAEQDQDIIVKLALLNSYDIFSLRSSMKKLGVDLTEELKLSDDMKGVLNGYTIQFTRPLIENIFGSERVDGDEPEALQNILRDPDVAKVRENLAIMTKKTGIPLTEIPPFLEQYADVFSSVAYYRFSFESISPSIERFGKWIGDIKNHRDVTATPQTMASCKKTDEVVRFLEKSIRERLNRLQYSFETFWGDINQASFASLQQQIEDNHSSMGAVLCGLVVKMRGWEKAFPENSAAGGPTTRAKFVVTDMEPGLDKLKNMENEARARLGLMQMK